MKLASVRFRAGVQHPPGVKASREVVASETVHLELAEATHEVTVHAVGSSPQVYSPLAWESYTPERGQICTICLTPLEPGAQGETCSKSCAAMLRHRRNK